MIEEEDVLKLFIQSIKERIENLENIDVDGTIIDELKLLLSDNIVENGMIHVRKSLMNKTFHLSFSNYKNVMNKYDNEHLRN